MIGFQDLINEYFPLSSRENIATLFIDENCNFRIIENNRNSSTITTRFALKDLTQANLVLTSFVNLESFAIFDSQKEINFEFVVDLTNCQKVRQIIAPNRLIYFNLFFGYYELEELKDRISDLSKQLTQQQASQQAQINQFTSQIQVKEQELGRVRNETVNSTAQLRIQITSLQGQLTQAQAEQGRLNGLLTNQAELQARISESERKTPRGGPRPLPGPGEGIRNSTS